MTLPAWMEGEPALLVADPSRLPAPGEYSTGPPRHLRRYLARGHTLPRLAVERACPHPWAGSALATPA